MKNILAAIMVMNTFLLSAELMDRTPDGKSTYNQWGSRTFKQKAPLPDQIDPEPRRALAKDFDGCILNPMKVKR